MNHETEGLLARIYGLVSEACHRVEKQHSQWWVDPNHFLIHYSSEVLQACKKAGLVWYDGKRDKFKDIDL